ncbi:hypothetical protein [Providencia sp. PROV209]|nr:hypothetical protein [Providencia sp. PROV209]
MQVSFYHQVKDVATQKLLVEVLNIQLAPLTFSTEVHQPSLR